jgi:hypothetical protein
MLAALPAKVLAPLQSTKVPLRSVADQHNVPAMPTVAAIRSPSGHMSLSAKADATVASGPTLNPDLGLVVHQLGE